MTSRVRALKEKWTRWEPINNLDEKYYVETIIDNSDGFKIVLSSAKDFERKIQIHFKDSVKAYRRTNETFSLQTVHFLDENYEEDFYGKWSFFKVANSEYLEWLNKQSFGISETFNFTHFCILGSDDMIDIAANYEPEVSHIA